MACDCKGLHSTLRSRKHLQEVMSWCLTFMLMLLFSSCRGMWMTSWYVRVTALAGTTVHTTAPATAPATVTATALPHSQPYRTNNDQLDSVTAKDIHFWPSFLAIVYVDQYFNYIFNSHAYALLGLCQYSKAHNCKIKILGIDIGSYCGETNLSTGVSNHFLIEIEID